jgi:hypothetical protein
LTDENEKCDVRQHWRSHVWSKDCEQDGTLLAKSNNALPIVSILSESTEKESVTKSNDWFVELVAVAKQKEEDDDRQSHGVENNLSDSDAEGDKQMASNKAWLFETANEEREKRKGEEKRRRQSATTGLNLKGAKKQKQKTTRTLPLNNSALKFQSCDTKTIGTSDSTASAKKNTARRKC